MIYFLASVLLVAGLAYAVWPLLRHAEPAGEPTVDPAGRDTDRIRLAIDEVELDVASGRLAPAEAEARMRELRGG